jgi:hypothetical protein
MKSGKSCVKHSKAAVRVAFLSGFAALAIQIAPASAADYGVGVLHNGTGSTILFPIRTETLNVEPEINFSKATGDITSRSLSIATGSIFASNSDRHSRAALERDSATESGKIN